jgi:hypothetical protein
MSSFAEWGTSLRIPASESSRSTSRSPLHEQNSMIPEQTQEGRLTVLAPMRPVGHPQVTTSVEQVEVVGVRPAASGRAHSTTNPSASGVNIRDIETT